MVLEVEHHHPAGTVACVRDAVREQVHRVGRVAGEHHAVVRAGAEEAAHLRAGTLVQRRAHL